MTEEEINLILEVSLVEAKQSLLEQSPLERLSWAYEKFSSGFVLTTSFGIQSSVLLHMIHDLIGGKKIPVLWVDTGYLPKETYGYAEQLVDLLNLDLRVAQSPMSPARMEALLGRLWETDCLEDIEKYHQIRKIEPLERPLHDLNVSCWASGVRSAQTKLRSSMTLLDIVRGRLSLRPLLDWTTKDVFYYMEKNKLPQHPLFEKGYSTVGDWHSSGPDTSETSGRQTRFGGLKQECGIHLTGTSGEGI